MKKPIDFEKWDKRLNAARPDVASRIITFVSFLVCAFAYQFGWDNLGSVVSPILFFQVGYFIGYGLDVLIFGIFKYVHDKKKSKEVLNYEKKYC